MLSGKGTVLISQKQNEHLTYQIYDHKPEYIQTLNQAALDLGYDSLISYLKKNSSSIEFNGQVLYTCSEELMDLKANSKLMISEDYQLFFFTELNDQKNSQAEKGLELSPLPKTKKAYEILLEFQQGKNLIIPSHTDATNDDYCLGLSYYTPEGEASGELWHDLCSQEYFFTNNTESNIYNHSGRKYGFYISQDDLSIRYLEREGELDESQLNAWRKEIKEKSLLYFLGLQHVESVHGSYSRRSAFIFNSENKLIMHYRTTDIGASHISDYIRIRLNDHLERINESFSNIKILLADGDHNAQTYLPDEAFSDERLNSYGFHFILRPFTHRASLSVAKTENTTETKSQGGFKSSKLVKDLKKKLTLLKPSSILSGFWRYKNNPQELFTRIKNNISILSLNDEIKSGRREFELRLNDENVGIEDCKRSDDFDLSTSKQSKNLQAENFLLNKKSLENFPHKSLINLNTEPSPGKGFVPLNPESYLPTAIYIKDFKINLKEIYKGYSTYVLDEQGSEKRLYLKTTKNIKILDAEPEAVSNIKEVMKNFIFHYGLSGKEVNIEEKNGQKQGKNNSHLRFDTQTIYPAAFCQSTLNEHQRKETEFSLAKLLFGFDTNHKLTSPYGLRSRHPITGETKFHHGIDYNALRGQTIYAPLDLKIYKSNFDKELGHYLIAEALNLENEIGEKLYILCAHLNEAQEQETGTIILKHSPLCKSGSTGLSTAPHLHFETRFAKMWDLYFEARSIDPIIVFYYLLNQE
jgi:murein DD-endopeptidase MepM/ murein hydrolase activator NlpD